MEFKLQTSKKESINLIPMVSVILLLIIFFLVAGTIRSPAFWDIKPPISKSKEKIADRNLQIYLNAEGKIAFEKQTISVDKLLNILQQKGTANLTLQVYADKNSDSQKIIDLINNLDKSLIKQLVLVTTSSE